MRKTFVAVLATGLFLLGVAGMANAALTTIGTAGYDSNGNGIVETFENYNLIWDDNSNGNSVIWLGYSENAYAYLSDQMSWAKNLNYSSVINGGLVNYMINPGYTVTWNPEDVWGLASIYELKDLYSEKIAPGAVNYFSAGLWNVYWSSTIFGNGPDVHKINMTTGDLGFNNPIIKWSGLAVRGATVNTVPEPASLLLIASSIVALVGLKSRKE